MSEQYCWLCGGQVHTRATADSGLCWPCQEDMSEDEVVLELFGFIGGEEKEAVA